MSDDATPPPSMPPAGDINDGSDDCFQPPAVPCECYCLHCNRVFQSDQMWYQRHLRKGGKVDGMWLCPTPNCGGAGFTFDIFPTDPSHESNSGWHYSESDDEEFDEDGEPLPTGEYDPKEPKYAEMDEWDGEDDDDLEGEEWKHGLQPGERPPEPEWASEARQHHEREQARFDAPDERPRELDLTNEPDPPARGSGIDESDIPF